MIFTYQDPIRFLRDWFAAAQRKNPRFSLRAWAKALGIKEATPLSQILKEKRPLPEHYLPRLKKILGFTDQEHEYFILLVQAKFARDEAHAAFCLRKAQSIAAKNLIEVHTIQDFQLFQDPLTMIIRELAVQPDFVDDPEWIASRLRRAVPLKRVRRSLETLFALGALEKDAAGKIHRRDRHVSSTYDVASLWIKNFHEQARLAASRAIYEQALDECEFGSYVLNVRLADLPAMKKAMREFTRNFIAQFDAPADEGQEVYQIDLSLFGWTAGGAKRALPRNPKKESA